MTHIAVMGYYGFTHSRRRALNVTLTFARESDRVQKMNQNLLRIHNQMISGPSIWNIVVDWRRGPSAYPITTASFGGCAPSSGPLPTVPRPAETGTNKPFMIGGHPDASRYMVGGLVIKKQDTS